MYGRKQRKMSKVRIVAAGFLWVPPIFTYEKKARDSVGITVRYLIIINKLYLLSCI